MNPAPISSDIPALLINATMELAVLTLGWAGAAYIARRDPTWRRVQDLVPPLLERLRQALLRLLTHLSAPAPSSQSWQQSRLRKNLV
ncbi:hypothetical protein DFAR_1830014 [Desulfarculales bacterium]